MKTHGDPGWEAYPSYLPELIPGVLDLLDRFRLKITFFIVGRDASLEKNREALRLITDRGHEVGNHSFDHEPWKEAASGNHIKKDILDTENHIFKVTGRKTTGFRGPGFAWSREQIKTLAANGYVYDASTLPMFLGPLARMYYFWKSRLNSEEKAQRKNLYGSFKDGLRPVKPYLWRLPSENTLLEIPVTSMPFLKIPFHLSYLLYISRYSETLMHLYLRTAIGFCKIAGVGPSFLLHSLDFIGGDRFPELSFFPGMDLSQEHKLRVLEKVLNCLMEHFRLSPMSVHAQSILESGKLKHIPLG